jgi:hypothetical protein
MRNNIIERIINEHTRVLLRNVEAELRDDGLRHAVQDLRLQIDQAIEDLKPTTTH